MTSRRIRVSGRTIEITRLEKPLFPESGLTKRDLIDYYRRIAATALPHYRDRPLTVERYPDGVGADGFFQKDRPEHYPDWMKSVGMKKQDGRIEQVVIDDAATLVYLANQACISFHLALARTDKPRHPDRLVFDLDPSDDDFEKVRRTAKRLKALLDELRLTSFVQTTGSRGLHVVVPIDRRLEFDRVRERARRVATVLTERHRDEITIEQRRHKRGSAVFVDYLRNAYGQTAVAPYSVRALGNAPIAVPLRWHELGNRRLHPQKYTIANIFRRLGRIEDPWAGIDRHAQSLDGLAGL